MRKIATLKILVAVGFSLVAAPATAQVTILEALEKKIPLPILDAFGVDPKSSFIKMLGYCRKNPCQLPNRTQEVVYGTAALAGEALKTGSVKVGVWNEKTQKNDETGEVVTMVVINQPCVGPCPLMVDRAPLHTCVGPGGSFTIYRNPWPHNDPPFTRVMDEWVKERYVSSDKKYRYPLPTASNMGNVLIMDAKEAERTGFAKPCPPAVMALVSASANSK